MATQADVAQAEWRGYCKGMAADLDAVIARKRRESYEIQQEIDAMVKSVDLIRRLADTNMVSARIGLGLTAASIED